MLPASRTNELVWKFHNTISYPFSMQDLCVSVLILVRVHVGMGAFVFVLRVCACVRKV